MTGRRCEDPRSSVSAVRWKHLRQMGSVALVVMAMVAASCTSESHSIGPRIARPAVTYRPYRAPDGAVARGGTYEIVRAGRTLLWVDLRPGPELGPAARPGAAPTRVWRSRDGRRWTDSGSAGFARLSQSITSSVVGRQVFLAGGVSNLDGRATDLVLSRSDDGGATWHTSTLASSPSITALARSIVAIRGRLVLIGAVGIPPHGTQPAVPERIAGWVSRDHGKTWRPLPASVFGPGDDFPLSVASTAGGGLVVVGQSDRVWTSRDGERWAAVPVPKPGGDFRVRSLGGSALAATEHGPGERVYLSADVGRSWRLLRLKRVPLADFAGTGYPEPRQFGRTRSTLWVEATGSPGSDSSSSSLDRSDDGGRTWHDTGLGRRLCPRDASQPEMRIDPPVDVGGTLVVAATCVNPLFVAASAVYLSTDGGRRWRSVPLPGPVARSALGPARVHGRLIRYDVRTEPSDSGGQPGTQQVGELIVGA